MATPRSATEVRENFRQLGYRQVQVYTHVVHENANNGRPPSYSMICEAVGIATKGEVSRIVKALERHGLVRRKGAGRSRRIALP